jgi:hypothetical protein
MKIKLTENQINMLKKTLAEGDMYSNEPVENTESPKEKLYNAINQSLDDDYSMSYTEFSDVISQFFNDYYGSHLKEKFLNVLNSKIV